MKEYFKPRPRFGKREHPYDIGRPFSWWKSHADRHFLNNLYILDAGELEAFYLYHLGHFLSKNEGADEKEYYGHVRGIVTDELDSLIKLGWQRSRKRHERNNTQKARLREFIAYLDGTNRWDGAKTKEEIIAAKETEIRNLKEQLESTKQKLREAQKLDTNDYINIPKNHVLTFLDLCLQLQETKLSDGRELVFSQTQIVWVKMICKHFRQDNEEINFDSIRRYFPGDRRNPGSKYAPIPAKKKLFTIVPAKKRS